ncbi:alanine racemase, N-terminal domain protein [Spiroplasma sabaudiense Ar-1343]|uniref:Alanine racemase, N-terminal domain protein n=2 Tax=Spiroplasma sabaudiense TaxID=216944 RepID=W6A975_9MOLU|nr:alanine racemase, N-terminal domain protein [Spiroplasma sabaudiense Ar-1343]
MAEFLVENGIKTIADSRILNLTNFQHLKVQKMLLRLPMLSEIDEVARLCDIVLISEMKTILALNAAAQKAKRHIKLILMIETGDIREGLLDKDKIIAAALEINKCEFLTLEGLGTNFACYGATKPTVEKLQKLAALKNELEQITKKSIPVISGGSSTHLTIWDEKNIPSEINQIRVGSAILMGIGLNDEPISWLKNNTIKLKAEIIEIQDKPSASWGPRALDAFAREVNFQDRGIRKKAIIALGRQDCPSEELVPLDSKIEVLGGSSDHTILDLTDSPIDYQVGDIIEFYPTYLGNLCLTTSKYVSVVYKK